MADGAAGFNLFHFGSHSGAELFNVIKTDHIFQNDDAVALQGRGRLAGLLRVMYAT